MPTTSNNLPADANSLIQFIFLHFVGPWPIFQFSNLFTIGRTPWTGDQSDTRPLPAHRTRETQNNSTQASMPQVGFEHTIPVFEREKS
jgi:hypothetical protein